MNIILWRICAAMALQEERAKDINAWDASLQQLALPLELKPRANQLHIFPQSF
jgi:hypothetical protein